MVLVVCWIVTSLSTIFLGLRVYAKLSRRCGLWWDDYILIVSWVRPPRRLTSTATSGAVLGLRHEQVLVLMHSISITVWVSYGYGMQIQDINPENIPTLHLLGEIIGTFTTIAASLSKTGFAIMLLRLAKPWMKKLICVMIVSMNIVSFLAALFFWISCTPVRKVWHPAMEGTCWDRHSLMIHVMFASGKS